MAKFELNDDGVVVIIGGAGVAFSGSSPKSLFTDALCASPLYTATQLYVPLTVGRYPPGLVPVDVAYIPFPVTVTTSDLTVSRSWWISLAKRSCSSP